MTALAGAAGTAGTTAGVSSGTVAVGFVAAGGAVAVAVVGAAGAGDGLGIGEPVGFVAPAAVVALVLSRSGYCASMINLVASRTTTTTKAIRMRFRQSVCGADNFTV